MRISALLLLPALVAPLQAQRLAPPALPSWSTPVPAASSLASHAAMRPAGSARPNLADPIVASLLGGVVAAWIGGYVGSRIRNTPCEDCGFEGGLYGATMGFGLGAAAGAHFAREGRGEFGTAALAGLAIGAAGTLAADHSEQWEILLVVPIAQIASAVALHRRPKRESRRAI